MNGPEIAHHQDPDRSEPRVRGAWLVLLGFVVATWSSMCGIGGGLFAVPTLHFLCGFSLRSAVATGLGLVAATTASATVAELLHYESELHLGLVAGLAAGVLIGAPIGFRISRKVRPAHLRLLFGLLLPAVGLEMLLGGSRAPAAAGELAVSLPEIALAAGIGLGAGLLSPLLGIGGGLIAVPSLFYGIGGLGFLGARACSMAMGIVTSGRSLLLYHKSGLLHVRAALCMGFGAVFGSLLGVRLVHLPSLTRAARAMMALTLLAVGFRYLYEAYRERRRAHSGVDAA